MGPTAGQDGGPAPWRDEATLTSLGVRPQDEALYRALLRCPRRTADELARELERTTATVRRGVRRLEELGLLTRTSGSPIHLVPTRPDVAVDVLVAQRQQELAHAQVASRRLLDEVPVERRLASDEVLEVLVGEGAVARRFEQLERSVRDELLVLDRPPYSRPVADANVSELELLERGVSVRGIYAPESLEVAGHLELLHAVFAAGEEARVHGSVPMKLAIADREIALLPVSLEQDAEQALVVRGSGLLTALLALFEMLWEQATPLPGLLGADGTPSGNGTGDRRVAAEDELVTLLSSGLTDRAVARQLGISQRTLNRRIAALMRELGARTRFQAGLKVAHERTNGGR